MSTAVILLCALATAIALPNSPFQPRNPPFQPRFPEFKLPSFAAPPCTKQLTKVTIAPGESVPFASPNYPDDYDSKSQCKWRFSSTENITITCEDDFKLESPKKSGKCKDKLTFDGTSFCGSTAPIYSGDKSINVVFKANKKKNYGGFGCIAQAGSGNPVTTSAPGTCKCGQANRASRIVGGVETEVLEYPWQAAMVFSRSTSVICGGSVIGSKHILTAAHCTQAVTDYGFSYQVMVGAHSLVNAASSQQILDAERFIQHADYSASTFDNDIAIIVLQRSLDFTATEVRPVCLPTDDSDAYDNTLGIVSGWGALEYQGGYPDVLMEVAVPTMSNSKCQGFYGGGITANMICAGYDAGQMDSCQGDSGGPLVTPTMQPYYYTQIGVVSFGNGCAWAGYPGVYARVTKYLSWIASNSASSTTCPAPMI